MIRIASRLPLILLLIFSAVAYAKPKPKTSVKVRVEGEFTDLHHEGDLSSALGSLSEDVTYINVTVTPDDSSTSSASSTPSALLMNDGKWCIKSMAGQTVQLTQGGTYSATLDGFIIDLEVPQAKGKPLKLSFTVFDHKWRSASDL